MTLINAVISSKFLKRGLIRFFIQPLGQTNNFCRSSSGWSTIHWSLLFFSPQTDLNSLRVGIRCYATYVFPGPPNAQMLPDSDMTIKKQNRKHQEPKSSISWLGSVAKNLSIINPSLAKCCPRKLGASWYKS